MLIKEEKAKTQKLPEKVRRIIKLDYSKPLKRWLVWILTSKGERDFIDFYEKEEAIKFKNGLIETHPFRKRKEEKEKPKKKKPKKKKRKRNPMKNITINLPELYDKNIQKLIKKRKYPSRSETIRTAIREFLYKEYGNLELLGFFDKDLKNSEKEENEER